MREAAKPPKGATEDTFFRPLRGLEHLHGTEPQAHAMGLLSAALFEGLQGWGTLSVHNGRSSFIPFGSAQGRNDNVGRYMVTYRVHNLRPFQPSNFRTRQCPEHSSYPTDCPSPLL